MSDLGTSVKKFIAPPVVSSGGARPDVCLRVSRVALSVS